MSHYRRTSMILNIAFLLIQFVTLLLTIMAKRNYFAGDVLVTTSLFVVYMILEQKFSWNLNNYLRALVILSIINHNLLGEYLNFYQSSPFFDRAVHFLGTYTFTLLAYFIIGNMAKKPASSKSREFVFVLSLGIALGAFMELAEFFTDTVLKPPVKYQPGLADTDLDIISDTFGALMAALHLTAVKFNIIKNG